MALRHVILPIGALLVLGLGLYLFFEVRAQPAIAQVDRAGGPAARRDPAEGHAAPDDSEPVPAAAKGGAVPPRLRHTTPDVRPSVAEPPTEEAPAAETQKADPKGDALMLEANKAYDRGDFDEAKGIATRVLGKQPTNVRMIRILVSTACVDGDSAEAQKQYAKLPVTDRTQMKTRCARYGITFTDP